MNPKQKLINLIENKIKEMEIKKKALIFQIEDCFYQFKPTIEQKIIICDQLISHSYKLLFYLSKDNTNQYCKISNTIQK